MLVYKVLIFCLSLPRYYFSHLNLNEMSSIGYICFLLFLVGLITNWDAKYEKEVEEED